LDVTKTAPANRSLFSLAYAQGDEKSQRHRQQPLPGKLFDATVFGLFLVFGVAYFM
jgi:hypothetical protein